MTEAPKRDRTFKKVIHYSTAIGVIVLAVPSALNDSYVPLIFILAGINLFNGAYDHFKNNKKHVLLLAFFSTMPILIYLALKYL